MTAQYKKEKAELYSRSTDNLVFTKTHRSGINTEQCVYIAFWPDRSVAIGDGPEAKLRFTPDEWRVFVAGIKEGEFDV